MATWTDHCSSLGSEQVMSLRGYRVVDVLAGGVRGAGAEGGRQAVAIPFEQEHGAG
jgi:hypothetical protein